MTLGGLASSATVHDLCGAMQVRYVYLGDRMTAERWRGQECDPVRRPDGRCVARRGTALVVFADGSRIAVNRRRLRLTEEARRGQRAIEYPAARNPPYPRQ